MIDELILHPQTKQQVVQYISRPSHALLLVGDNGVGKGQLAAVIAAEIVQLSIAGLYQHPYFSHIEPEKDSISIDLIRQLQRFLQLKTLGTEPLRRIVIIEHAEGLTTEAQNAYLKLLEEPPADTLMILTVDNQRALLPTILSRLPMIMVCTPAEIDVKAYFSAQGNDTATLNQAFFLSGGLPGLMHALLAGDVTHPLMEGVTLAKEILQKQTFERLALIDGLAKQKDTVKYVIEALLRIAQTMLDQSAKQGDQAKLRQWLRILKVSSDASTALSQNANAKLVLSNLMLHV
jgi:DNA polymerase-3 subunit delta'